MFFISIEFRGATISFFGIFTRKSSQPRCWFQLFCMFTCIRARLDEPNLTFACTYFFRKGGINSTTNQGATDFNRMFPKIVVHPIIHFYRVFYYKPSILGYPYCWKHPTGYDPQPWIPGTISSKERLPKSPLDTHPVGTRELRWGSPGTGGKLKKVEVKAVNWELGVYSYSPEKLTNVP